MLYTIHGIEWTTLAALGVEFSMMPRFFSLIARFDHCAVLCGESWIRGVARIESFVIPGLSIESFARGEEKTAQAWLDTGS